LLAHDWVCQVVPAAHVILNKITATTQKNGVTVLEKGGHIEKLLNELQAHEKHCRHSFFAKKAIGNNLSSCLSQVDGGLKKYNLTSYN
jgi:hypothetical protein